MRDITIAITAASYSGNKGAAAMLQSSIKQLYAHYGERLHINLMSVYPSEDKEQIPFDFIKVVPAKPAQLLFLAFPLAILYFLLGWIPFVKKILGKHPIIQAYRKTDIVIDEAGISFVDSRGAVMNIYAFVCAAVPLLLGVPVVKYSQAMGSFHSPLNRFLAKWILPKLRLICARGEVTRKNLESIGITKNVRLCADGAFSMPDDADINAEVEALCSTDSFYNDNVIALSISSVVQGKCTKLGIDYAGIMTQFIDELTVRGHHILIIANAARVGSDKPRNNDLMICNEIYARVQDKDSVRWYDEEMTPEKIRALIGRSRVLVASRFHAMIGALEQGVPTLLIGWSHKYQEVLDMFTLGEYAADFSKLSLPLLLDSFDRFMSDEADIRARIQAHLPQVLKSSRENITQIASIADDILTTPKRGALLDMSDTERYIGEHITCRMGYAADEAYRANAASGGMVTAMLCHLLESGQIDGAWVTRSEIKDGKLGYKTFVATTKQQLMDASSSVYMHMPLLRHIDEIAAFEGKLAVVLVPCQMRAFTRILAQRPELSEKIALKISLYCSGSHTQNATLVPLQKRGISLDNATRIYYKRGHWRGQSSVVYTHGQETHLSYTKNICAYKNAYFFTRGCCLLCQDHYGNAADISFGDIWLSEMKKHPIKHTSCVIRSEGALAMYRSAVKAGVLIDSHIGDEKIVRSQKRALVFAYNCAKAKVAAHAKQGKKLLLDTKSPCKWNHRLAWWLAEKNRRYSEEHLDSLKKVPTALIYYYMLFIRLLLSF